MEVQFLEKGPGQTRFILRDSHFSFANSLRRAMVAEVPTLAIEEVNFYENTGALYDEQLALRLGLIPIQTDLESYVPRSKCTCENGCPRCQLSLTLSVEGPRLVTSGDLVSSDPKIGPADPRVPIIKLKEGQKLVLEALARVGCGRDHIRWQPVVACGYKYLPRVKVSKENANWERLAEVCPARVFAPEKGKYRDENACTFCNLCIQAASPPGSVTVTEDRSAFVFTFETDGSLPPEEVLQRAAEALKEKATEFKKHLEANGKA
ncbi:MAG: DNA-directed RNA polymerase subunit D [Euryarchaeota archaeon]|nr:DNA-directed RNA polymerase subunit D [Euryarchaeota archaeon]